VKGPLGTSPRADPSLVEAMVWGVEGIVLKDRSSTYRDGSRAGSTKVNDASRFERGGWRFRRP
jgi:hypothetical protein